MAINFDLNDLQAFRAVAELSNFRKAAESVHLSQPAFSRRIDKLEQALGVRLLDRTTRRVSLTAVGRDFERKVQQLLDDLDHTLLGIRGVAATRMGEVTIACVPSTVYYFLSQVIRRYHERYPKIRVKVFDASANEVLAAVARGEADFGLNFIGAQEPDIEFKPLLEERFVAACRRDHPLAKQAPRELDRAGAVRLHLGRARPRATGCCSTRRWPACAGRPQSIYETQHVTTMLGLVEAGPRRGRGAVDGDAGRGPSAAGQRAAGRPGRHAQGRPDPAQGPLPVAGGAAALRVLLGDEGNARQAQGPPRGDLSLWRLLGAQEWARQLQRSVASTRSTITPAWPR